MVTIWVPLPCFLIILLFPFYWMTVTAFKLNAELYDYNTHNPFWITSPTLDHIRLLLFGTAYPRWLLTTMTVAVWRDLPLAAVLDARRGLCDPAAAPGQPVCRAGDLPGLPGAALDPVHPLATMVFQLGLFDTPLALILVYPTFLVPFCAWLLIGYPESIPMSWRNAR